MANNPKAATVIRAQRHPPRTMSRAGRAACSAGILLLGACTLPRSWKQTDSSVLTTGDILHRCVATYDALGTLQARGTLRDYRKEPRRAAPISWDFQRPDRCRLQIDMDVALVLGKHWWTSGADTGRYRKHRQFTNTPMLTAAYLLSAGVPFLLPDLFARGGPALGLNRPDAVAADWRMVGVAWHADRPCYVLTKQASDRQGAKVLRVWIDQDRFLIRGWALSAPGTRGRRQDILGCTYYDLVTGTDLPADRFQLKPPVPITFLRKGAETAAPASDHDSEQP